MLQVGYVVYCDLKMGLEHTGLYLGNDMIAELNGEGDFALVTTHTFLNYSEQRIGEIIYIPYSPYEESIITNPMAAINALCRINEKTEYNLLLNNCHQFVAGALTGDFENGNNTFWSLTYMIEKQFHNGRKLYWRPLKRHPQQIDQRYWTEDFFLALERLLKRMTQYQFEENRSSFLKSAFTDTQFRSIIQKAKPSSYQLIKTYQYLLKKFWSGI